MMKPWEQQEYNKGRQARLENQSIDTCHHRDAVVTAWRRAGYHDLDMEKGNRKYFAEKESVCA